MGAVSVLAAVAVADAIRKPSGEGRAAREVAAERLRAAGLSGTLVVSGNDCRLGAVRLPALAPVALDDARACRVSIAGDGRLTLGDAVPQPGGPFRAWCRDGWVELAAHGGSSLPFTRLYRFGGCGPAWKPSGVLTYVRAGELVELRMRCGGGGFCTRALLTSADVRRSLGRAGLVEVAWLDDATFAAIAREASSRRYALAILERGRLRALARFGAERLAGLRASPHGTYLAVRRGEAGRVAVLDRSLRPVPLPASLRGARAIAWSPDERWLAAAVGEELLLSPLPRGRADPIRVRLAALDVAWYGGKTEAYPLRRSR